MTGMAWAGRLGIVIAIIVIERASPALAWFLVALAALSLARGSLFPPADSSGLEIAMTAAPTQIVVIGTGHWRGEGIALVETVAARDEPVYCVTPGPHKIEVECGIRRASRQASAERCKWKAHAG